MHEDDRRAAGLVAAIECSAVVGYVDSDMCSSWGSRFSVDDEVSTRYADRVSEPEKLPAKGWGKAKSTLAPRGWPPTSLSTWRVAQAVGSIFR
jgi:hypothetical protein